MEYGLVSAAYISASVLFILSLGALSNQEKAKRAVWFGIAGMAVSVVFTIFSGNSGNFSTVVKVDAYKCGQRVASIYREIQAVQINCAPMSGGGPNNPPLITAPVGTQNWTTTLNPSGLPTYSTTVNAGELVVFDIVISCYLTFEY